MRLAITKSGFYNADYYCADTRSAKRMLREQNVSLLAIDYYLIGKGNGCELIEWAHANTCLPNYVVIIERDRARRLELARALQKAGLASRDQTNFLKH